VRLTVGGTRYERPLELRADPTVQVAAAELQRQFELALKLRDMQSELNDALRGLDVMRSQLDERRKSAAIVPGDSLKPLIQSLDRQLARVDSVLGTAAKPAGKAYWSEGPRLAERLGALLGGIDGGNRAPTAAQAAHFAELQDELRRILADIARFRAASVADLPR
jgi:hypothetical protein